MTARSYMKEIYDYMRADVAIGEGITSPEIAIILSMPGNNASAGLCELEKRGFVKATVRRGRAFVYERIAEAVEGRFKIARTEGVTRSRGGESIRFPRTLPRVDGPAPRPDLFGGKIDHETLGEDPFPHADRLDATEKVDVTLDNPRVGPAKTEQDPAFPNFVKIGELLYPVGPLTADPEKRLSVQIREIADRIEALEDVIDLAAKKLGLPLK